MALTKEGIYRPNASSDRHGAKNWNVNRLTGCWSMRLSFIQIEFIRPNGATGVQRHLAAGAWEEWGVKISKAEEKKKWKGDRGLSKRREKRKKRHWRDRKEIPHLFSFPQLINESSFIEKSYLSPKGEFQKKKFFQSKTLSALNHRFHSTDLSGNESIIGSLQWIILNEFAPSVRDAKYTYLRTL